MGPRPMTDTFLITDYEWDSSKLYSNKGMQIHTCNRQTNGIPKHIFRLHWSSKYLIPSKFCDLLAIKVFSKYTMILRKKILARPWNSKITYRGRSFEFELELEAKALTHCVVNNRVSTITHSGRTWNEREMNIGPSFHLISRNLTAHWKENLNVPIAWGSIPAAATSRNITYQKMDNAVKMFYFRFLKNFKFNKTTLINTINLNYMYDVSVTKKCFYLFYE
jgi:hypothetical protein